MEITIKLLIFLFWLVGMFWIIFLDDTIWASFGAMITGGLFGHLLAKYKL